MRRPYDHDEDVPHVDQRLPGRPLAGAGRPVVLARWHGGHGRRQDGGRGADLGEDGAMIRGSRGTSLRSRIGDGGYRVRRRGPVEWLAGGRIKGEPAVAGGPSRRCYSLRESRVAARCGIVRSRRVGPVQRTAEVAVSEGALGGVLRLPLRPHLRASPARRPLPRRGAGRGATRGASPGAASSTCRADTAVTRCRSPRRATASSGSIAPLRSSTRRDAGETPHASHAWSGVTTVRSPWRTGPSTGR